MEVNKRVYYENNKNIKEEALYFTYLTRRSLRTDSYKFWVSCSSPGRIINSAKFYRNQLRSLDFVGVGRIFTTLIGMRCRR